MSVRTTIQRRLGFTRNELIVILFLSTTLCVGASFKVFFPRTAGTSTPQFDYTQADSEYVALSKAAAGLLADGAERAPGGDRGKTKTPPAKGGIKINTASAQELTQLPGIGPAIAERIVEYRKQHGRFKTVDDLTNVSGIGPKKLDKLRPFATAD